MIGRCIYTHVAGTTLCNFVDSSLRGQKVGYGMVVDGIAKFQALKFTFQGLRCPVILLVLLVRRRIPHKFQALKFQNSGPEIWRFHPPPFHTPPFAYLLAATKFDGSQRGPCLLFVRKRSRSSKDRSGLRKVPRTAEPLGFCSKVLRSISHSKKFVEERFCRTLGAKPSFSDLANPLSVRSAETTKKRAFWRV